MNIYVALVMWLWFECQNIKIKILQHIAFKIAITIVIASIAAAIIFEIGTALTSHDKKDDDTEKPNFEILCCFFVNVTLVVLSLLLSCLFCFLFAFGL